MQNDKEIKTFKIMKQKYRVKALPLFGICIDVEDAQELSAEYTEMMMQEEE